MLITKQRLQLAGWFSIINGVIAIPIFGISMSLTAAPTAEVKTVMAGLDLLSLGLCIYALLALKGLLNSRFQFPQVDIYISCLVGFNIAIYVLNGLVLSLSPLEQTAGTLSSYATIALGIINVLFGAGLLHLSNNLYGLLKLFAYPTILLGLCYATVFLVPLGIIVGIATDIVLGIIFLKAAQEG